MILVGHEGSGPPGAVGSASNITKHPIPEAAATLVGYVSRRIGADGIARNQFEVLDSYDRVAAIMTRYTTATAMPAPALQTANFLASSEAFCASAVRPWAHSPDTWVDLTIDTTPNGRQQSTVDKIAHTR